MTEKLEEFLRLYNSEHEKDRIMLTDEQKKVIKIRQNTVCSANAGSGKTTVLALRYLDLIFSSEENVMPENILTLTFTRKAAAEMLERIESYLIFANRKGLLSDETYSNFAKAQISTIDSFLSQIVKLGAMNYGIPRDFQTIEAMNVHLYLNEYLKDGDNRKKFSFLRKFTLSSYESIATVLAEKAIVLKYFDSKKGLELLMDKLNKINVTDLKSAENECNELLDSIKSQYPIDNEKIDKEIDKIKSAIAEGKYGEKIESTTTFTRKFAKRNSEILKTLMDFNGMDKSILDNYDQNSKDNPLSIIKNKYGEKINLCKLLSNLLTLYCGALSYFKEKEDYDRAAENANHFVEFVKNYKRINGQLTFSDISSLAYDILKNDVDIRQYFKKKFSFIMIDEFQDDNKLQKEILYLLAEKEDREEKSVPKPDELEKEKLFFVGDDKQSIYRFRGADVSVFKGLKNELGENSLLSISQNFRSTKPLIDHYNLVFNESSDFNDPNRENKDYEADFSSRMKEREHASTGSVIRFAYSIIDKDSKYKGEEIEAEYIASQIVSMVSDENSPWAKRHGRLLRFSDILILYRSSTNKEHLEKALKKRNIPYNIDGPKDLTKNAIASDFAALFSAMLYEDDYASRAELLLSPFIGLDVKEVNSILNEKGLSSYLIPSLFSSFDKKELENKIKPSILETLSFFNEKYSAWKEAMHTTGLPDLIRRIWEESGYSSFLKRNGYMEYELHYEYLFSYAEKLENEGKGIMELIEKLRDENGFSNETLNVYSMEENSVSLMTIHKSKGLGYPVVILYNASAEKGNSNGNRQNEIDRLKNASLIDDGFLTFLKVNMKNLFLEKHEEEYETAEMKRLFYVALTRAKNHLMVTASFKLNYNQERTETKIDKLTLKPFLEWYMNANEMKINNEIIIPQKQNAAEIEKIDPDSIFTSSYLAIKKSEEIHSSPEFLPSAKTIAVTELDKGKKAKGERIVEDSKTISLIKGSEDAFGTLVHLILEKSIKKESLDNIQIELGETEENKTLILNYAKKLSSSFFDSSFAKELFKEAEEISPEKRFFSSSLLIFPEKEEYVFEGIMDLVVKKKDRVIIVDYKTDSIIDPEIHRAQIEVYKKVAANLYDGNLKVQAYLFYLKKGKEIEV